MEYSGSEASPGDPKNDVVEGKFALEYGEYGGRIFTHDAVQGKCSPGYSTVVRSHSPGYSEKEDCP